MPVTQSAKLTARGQDWLEDKPALLRQLNYIIKDIYWWLDYIRGIEGHTFAPSSMTVPDHDHTAADEGGDYPWADLVVADVTYLQTLVADILVNNLVDKSSDETITGTWIFQKYAYVTKSGAGPFNLTSDDYGKKIFIDNGVNNVVVNLPDIDASSIGYWLSIVRMGTGTLSIQAKAGDTIGPSSAGGYVLSMETRTYPELGLEVESATHWSPGAMGSYGIWRVF